MVRKGVVLCSIQLFSLFAKLCLPSWPIDTFESYRNKVLEKQTTKERRRLWVKSGNKLLGVRGTA